LTAPAIFAQPAQDRNGIPQKNRVFLIAVLIRFGAGFPASFDTKAVGWWCGRFVPRAHSFTDLRCRENAMCVGQELCRDSASGVCELPDIDTVGSEIRGARWSWHCNDAC
jgi:hypothetical protein